jgi:hypothetical protein
LSNEGPDPDRRWLRRVVRAERTAERVVELPLNLVGRGHPVSDSAKRRIYEAGVDGRATILTAPDRHRVSEVKENLGRFTVSVDLPGRTPYEAKVWQAFWAAEWRQLRPGTTVDCTVDAKHPNRVWLQPVVSEVPAKSIKGPTLDLGSLFRRR